jgi:transposase
MKGIQEIVLPYEEAEGLLQRLDTGALTEDDLGIIKAIIKAYLLLSQAVQDNHAKIKRLLRILFGAKTEKAETVGGCPASQGKAAMERSVETSQDSGEDTGEKPKGHGRNGASAYTGAEKIALSHPVLKPGDACPGCQRGKVYHMPPPGVAVRITGGAPLQAKVWEMEKLRCNLCGEVFAAHLPREAGTKKYDETSGAMIALLKYGGGFPFNRLEQLQESMGIPLPASTQWDIVEKEAGRVYPAYHELIQQAAQGELIHNDDTMMKILELVNNEGKDGGRNGTFTTGILSVVDQRKIVLFFTGRRHAGENITDLLALRRLEMSLPIQMCDALSRNISKEFLTILANCLTHARRNFVEVADNFPEECSYVIETLAEVYKNDKAAKEEKMTPLIRLHYHQAHSGPLMKQMHEWMTDQMESRKVEPNSGLGKAISYMMKHWEPLTLFLRVEGAPLDNNICEQALKRAILHRKNSLFYKTLRGAQVGDIFMSLIHTCKLAKVNPFDYLVALQKHAQEVLKNPHEWLPWNYKAEVLRCQREHSS